MRTKLITPPESEPITLEEAKEHMRVIGTNDDKYITRLISAARMDIEEYISRALLTQTWELYLDGFYDRGMVWNGEIIIPRPPLQSVESIKYYDSDGVLQTWEASKYQVDVVKEPARVKTAYGYSYPSTQAGKYNSVIVNYKAGYGDKKEDVPSQINQAILIMVAELYERRESAIVGAPIQPVTMDVAYLLSPQRIVY